MHTRAHTLTDTHTHREKEGCEGRPVGERGASGERGAWSVGVSVRVGVRCVLVGETRETRRRRLQHSYARRNERERGTRGAWESVTARAATHRPSLSLSLCGCVGVCVCGCVGLWVCECVGVWVCCGRGVVAWIGAERVWKCGGASAIQAIQAIGPERVWKCGGASASDV